MLQLETNNIMSELCLFMFVHYFAELAPVQPQQSHWQDSGVVQE